LADAAPAGWPAAASWSRWLRRRRRRLRGRQGRHWRGASQKLRTEVTSDDEPWAVQPSPVRFGRSIGCRGVTITW